MVFKRHNRPPALDSSFLAWARPLYEVDELDMLRLVGVDALALMRTYKLGLQVRVRY
jgi:hypothetical protein